MGETGGINEILVIICTFILSPFVRFNFKFKAMKKLYTINSNSESWLIRKKPEDQNKIKVRFLDKAKLLFKMRP